jgi:Tol biopolymer transport system component
MKRVLMAQVGGPQASLFSDGSRIYFNEGASDAPSIVQVSALGGDTGRLPMPGLLPSLLDLSSPRSEMLVSGSVGTADAPPLWIVPLPAGQAHALNGITAWDAAWSADGRALAYVRGRELFVAGGDGSRSRRLAVLPGNGWHPRWSPDGKRIRLTVFDIPSARSSLWELHADGTGLRPLLNDWRPTDTTDSAPVGICCGTWSPDGRDFVFQVSEHGRSDIWWLPGEDGWLRSRFGAYPARPIRITAGQLSSLAPAFSPDGRKLFVIGQELRGELQRYDRRAGQFVSYLGGLSADFVDFSRDGNWLLYVTYPELTLWRSRTDGTERRQLTFPPLEATVSRWSPDEKKILTFSIGGGDGQGALLLPAAGGESRPVSPTRGEMQPSWSPDGSSIMYSDFPFFSKQPAKVSVHIQHLATNQVETLPGSEGLFAPQWSPDGKHVAALVLNGRRLMLYDFQTQTWSELAQGFGLLHWSVDSQWVYYMRYMPSPAILRVRIANRHVEEVASLKGIRLAGLLAGLEFSVTPKGEPIITRDVGTQEVYSMDWSQR